MYPDYGLGNPAATRLRRQPARLFEFDRAALRDVLRYLADEAEMPFVGIPENDSANRRLVTFTMEASPFIALESVCRDNGIRLTFENGVWFMRSVDEQRERRIKEEEDNKLVGIAYTLRYDPVDRVDFRQLDSSGAQQQTSSGGTVTTATSPNLPLQNSQRVFEAKAPRIVNEIRVMLGLPPITYNPDGSVQGERIEAARVVDSTAAAAQTTEAAPDSPARLTPTYVPPQTPQVIYNSDTNTLWVVATRQQHAWVRDYLIAVDRPQELIAIEVKFFETTKDPSKELGINWAQTMQGGYNVTLQDMSFSTGSVDITRTAPPGPGESTISITPSAPYSAVLTASDVSLALQAFMSDRKTSMVQYPRVLTVNNREVAITSAENTPINAGVSQVATGSTAVPVGTLGYLPVGTQINILPKTLGEGRIALTVAITISSIINEREINLGTGPSSYPVTSERIYNAALQVDSGYTLAVGGLEAVDDRRLNNGIPLLQDIPGVGELFKSKARTRNRKNLIVFITPSVINDPRATRGITEEPEAVIPIRPDDPTPPAFTPDGHLVGGAEALNGALAWFEMQIRLFKQINKENTTDKESIKRLRAVIASVRMTISDIELMREEGGNSTAADLERAENRAVGILTELNRVLAAAQNNIM